MELNEENKELLTKFAKLLLPAIEEFYKDEKNVREFEEWRKRRDKDYK